MRVFRGYVPTKNKQCLEKFKGRKRLNTLEDVADLDEYAGILGAEAILIDVDDAQTSDLLFQIVQDLELRCRVYQTTRGKHFIFKNPEGLRAWELIKKSGCAELQVGGAKVSDIHCNFLINTGHATAKDIETLGETIIQRVKQSTAITLEWEIKRLGIQK